LPEELENFKLFLKISCDCYVAIAIYGMLLLAFSCKLECRYSGLCLFRCDLAQMKLKIYYTVYRLIGKLIQKRGRTSNRNRQK